MPQMSPMNWIILFSFFSFLSTTCFSKIS
uniref:ATP synthase F0 subunit 8 n=1 Tax=Amphiascoides atopus TaxID=1352461 RepID=W8DNA7_9MAXI|nr:ATP synthase F0 subunit 8 [Amphiascoides atopus]AHB52762.1 ATP synthase F0 subunit 8 [Amphiascoides atopus]